MAVAAAAAGIAIYASSDPPEAALQHSDIASEDFRLPESIPVKSFTVDQVMYIGRQVCGGVGREDWVPQRVAFAYLEPEETVYRIPCGLGPAGYFYRSFYFSGAGPAIIDEYHPNAQSLFDISSPAQAAEYVMHFDIVLAGEQGNKEFVITEQDYERWAEQCTKDYRASEAKGLTVNGSGDGYSVQLSYVDSISGLFEYRQYMVSSDGTIELLAERTLGDCGIAI